jgi:hypothetical protein
MGRPVTGASKLYLSLGFLSVLLIRSRCGIGASPLHDTSHEGGFAGGAIG